MDNNDLIKTKGLVDRHFHGGYGVNFNTCSEKDVVALCQKLPKHGVVSVLPTIMTDTIDNIQKQIQIIKHAKNNLPEGSAQILGIHLEGPFLNPLKKGIHPKELILEPTIENYLKLEDPEIKIVTLAPELDKDFELINYLKSKNVTVSAGHSVASPSQTSQTGQVTHLFNAMSSLSHREPNILSESLVNDSVYTEVIADGVHIHKDILNLFFKIKNRDRILLVSDALPIAYFNGDKVIFAGEEIFLKEGKAVDKHGTMAGSSVFLDDIIRFLVSKGLYSFENCIKAAAENVLASLKLPQTEDYVVWDKQLNIKEVSINGFVKSF